MPTIERQDPPADVLSSGRPGALHRLTGALPVCAALIAVAVAVVLHSAPIRHTLHQSFQRQPEHYLELYFTDPGQAQACSTVGRRTTVLATVLSHLADTEALPYLVSLTADGRTLAQVPGTVAAVPGTPVDFGATLKVPPGPYGVSVTLPGRAERLSVHCPKG